MRVAGVFDRQATLLPHAHDGVVLSLELFEEGEGAVAELLRSGVPSIGVEHGHHGVDDKHVLRCLRQLLVVRLALLPEGVMSVPVGCGPGRQHAPHVVERLAVGHQAQGALSRAVEVDELGYAYVRKVLRSEPQKAPHAAVYGCEVKLMGEVCVLA